ncbi:lipopolysaccharide biosynthesis protein [Priestia sp. 40]|uniref:lipopolysaccharide biosynthesis protein n=2 Tax=Priestia TaxID=2800373 RepID=UPI0011BB3353|nr:hypothetical protein [Priestia megaterium]QDZ81701.1 hypothetical protein D0440_20360 [Priestia megaterium]
MLKMFSKLAFFRYGLIEQSIMSLLNFLIIIFYSRFMAVESFADFVLIYSAISLVFLVCSSLFSAPILVFLPVEFKIYELAYIRYITRYNIGFTFFLTLIVLWLMNLYILNLTLIEGMYSIIFSIAWTQYELLRKLNYGRSTVKGIFVGSIALVGCFSTLNLIWKDSMSVQTSFLVLSSSYLLGIFATVLFDFIKHSKKEEHSYLDKKKVINKHWKFAKWTVVGNLLYWACTQGFFILIANYISDKELGGLRTAMNLLGLITILLVLFENTFTPKISKLYKDEGVDSVNRYIHSLHSKITPIYLIIIIVVTTISYFSFDIVFGKNFEQYKYLTMIFGVYQLALGLNRPSVVGLRALNKTKHFFTGNFIGTVVTIFIGLFLTIKFHELGSAVAIAFSGICITVYFRRSFNKEISKASLSK